MSKLSDAVGNKTFLKVLAYGKSGAGKCLARGTPVIKFDGTIVPVEEIVVGDILLGPDSLQRKVKSLGYGRSKMFKVIPIKGDEFICNDKHIITVYKQNTKEILDIPIDEFISKHGMEPSGFCLVRSSAISFGAEWKSLMSPYEVGVWLGDGTTRNPSVTKNDPEIELCWKLMAERFGLGFNISIDKRNGVKLLVPTNGRGAGKNAVYEECKKFISNGQKYIPHWSHISSIKDRFDLLAGLLDTDGYLGHGTFEFSSKFEHIANSVCFITRSLGLAAYKSPKTVNGTIYWRVSISGNTNLIPTRIKRKQAEPRRQIKDVLKTGFIIEEMPEDEYFGFTIDSDGRFLLGDFTITHNTVFGTSFPKPLKVADFDGKITSAANYWNVKDKSVLDQIDYDNYMVSPERNGAMSYRKFLADLSALEKQVIEGKFTLKTYVVDSLTALADQMMASIISENPGLKRTEAMTPVMQDWMIFTPHMKSLIYRVLSLPCNIVVIGHVLTEKDETTNMISNQISLPGKLPDLLPKLFGEVYYCHIASNDAGKTFQHVALTKSPTEKFVTRTQIQGLPNIIPMDYEFIKSVMSKTESKE